MENTQQTQMLWVCAHMWIRSSHRGSLHFLWFCSSPGCHRRNKCRFYCKREKKNPACKDLAAQDLGFDSHTSQLTCRSLSLGRPTQEVCSSRLEESVATSPVRFYTIMSHVHGITLGLNVTACFFQDSLSRLGQRPLLISATGADSSSDAVFKHCQHMVSERRHPEITLFGYVNVQFLSEHERRGQAEAAEHRHLLLRYGWEWRNGSGTGRHGRSSADHRGICEHSWQNNLGWKKALKAKHYGELSCLLKGIPVSKAAFIGHSCVSGWKRPRDHHKLRLLLWHQTQSQW